MRAHTHTHLKKIALWTHPHILIHLYLLTLAPSRLLLTKSKQTKKVADVALLTLGARTLEAWFPTHFGREPGDKRSTFKYSSKMF